MSDKLHGDYNKHGNRRWCKGCEEWVAGIDWDDHFGCYGYTKSEIKELVGE